MYSTIQIIILLIFLSFICSTFQNDMKICQHFPNVYYKTSLIGEPSDNLKCLRIAKAIRKPASKSPFSSRIAPILMQNILTNILNCSSNTKFKNLAANCLTEREKILTELENGETWAYKFEDSHGIDLSGTAVGRKQSYGEYDQCKSISANVKINGVDEKWEGSYARISFMGLRPDIFIPDSFIIAFCVAPNCREFMENVKDFRILNENCSVIVGEGDLKVEKKLVPLKSDKSSIGGIVFFSIFGFFMAVGSILDYYISFYNKGNRNWAKGNVARFFLPFSLYTNIPKLLKGRHSPGSFTAIHGVRAITVSWIVLTHVYLIYPQIGTDINRFGDMMRTFTFQAVVNGQMGVDTFLVLSGFLSVHAFIRDMKKTNNNLPIKKIINHFVHRFWRILPMYAAVICFYSTFYERIRQGPRNMVMKDIHFCKKYWWRNILFINNLFPFNDICMGHTWYLGVDMQLYVVAAFGLFLYVIIII
ncbi:DgyrCDS14920 [Dimorphilus gyrociliatus]|uniref:DgyrCDS14920 n=1 Tax=Dimorphilus gyrociliatus TaxID=2664684 RepID=A0A7I8WFM1_9ANNE|nr:DgyrCDS14920 [Dimorphilus gyrociliatus]